MPVQRREVLKWFTTMPFLGLVGNCAEAKTNVKPKAKPRQREHTWRMFEEPFLSEIAFPLGGIGTGTVSLGGRGNLRDWEICNHPYKGHKLDNTFFGLWFKEENQDPHTFILESQIPPPYRGGFGLDRAELPGMPRFHRGRFLGSYPFARLELEDDRVPLDIALECFNPMIPHNENDSGLPVAIFYWQVKNRSKKPVDLTIMASLSNIAGSESFGKNLNEFVDAGAFRGLKMTTSKFKPNETNFGNLALVSPHKQVTYTPRWDRGGWFDAQSLFWDDFSADGRLEPMKADPTPDNRTDTGSLGAVLRLNPGESATVPFLITWYFPNRENYWNSEKEVNGKIVGNFYSTFSKDAWEVAEYVVQNLTRLERETRLFHDALFSSSLPAEVLDAVSSQASIIRTNTCFRTQDGKFFGFEGCGDKVGCCPLNCAHVYNYEQSLAFLFPSLERSMRDTDFNFNTNETGHMAFRTMIPLGLTRWGFKYAAADGQMGTIVKLYREWQLSGDMEFLKSVWPGAKRALEYAWKEWDPDRDGVMTGIQHNTYDIEFHGPNPFTGVIYLTGLRAGEEMAWALGDQAAAEQYRKVYETGRVKLENLTWNGEFYIQVGDKAKNEKYQLGEGCLSDQVLGQWMAHVMDLGYLLPEDHMKTAIRSIYQYNFKETLSEHYNPQRVYALGDESGLLLASWPRGNRPKLPFPYSDEVWTGIEYQVAAHLIYEGFIEEGLNIVRGVRNRYDGERRNPWNEVECGDQYARAMASWSLLLALSGFHYSAPRKRIAFAPVVNKNDFTCFWSMGAGWGTYRQKLSSRKLDAEIQMLYGEENALQVFSLPAPSGAKASHPLKTKIAVVGLVRHGEVKWENGKAVVRLIEPVKFRPGVRIAIEVGI